MAGELCRLRLRRAFRLWPVLTIIGLTAFVSGVVYIVFPTSLDQSVIAEGMPRLLTRAWSVAYAVGGACVLIGLYRPDAQWEVAGLALLAGCYLSYAVGIVTNRGFPAASVGAPIFLAMGIGCMVRALLLRFEPHVGVDAPPS